MQLARCLSLEHAAAAFDSLVHREPAHAAQLEQWLAGVPRHILTALPPRDPLCHIEWDGSTHFGPAQHREDRRRDALRTAMGYRVLRFSYPLVMDEWHIVLAAIRSALAPD